MGLAPGVAGPVLNKSKPDSLAELSKNESVTELSPVGDTTVKLVGAAGGAKVVAQTGLVEALLFRRSIATKT